jgi:hypothetical protein
MQWFASVGVWPKPAEEAPAELADEDDRAPKEACRKKSITFSQVSPRPPCCLYVPYQKGATIRFPVATSMS